MVITDIRIAHNHNEDDGPITITKDNLKIDFWETESVDEHDPNNTGNNDDTGIPNAPVIQRLRLTRMHVDPNAQVIRMHR